MLRRPSIAAHGVDNADWLKSAAIIFAFAGHFGYFFVENDRWWSVFGRFPAPTFFFLLGYARSRTVPLHWIWLGATLTALESWNAHWTWVAPSILLSFAVLRLVRPYALALLQTNGWAAFVVMELLLFAHRSRAAGLIWYRGLPMGAVRVVPASTRRCCDGRIRRRGSGVLSPSNDEREDRP